MFNIKDYTLLIPEKVDTERESVAQVWQNLNGEVVKVGKFWQKPDVNTDKVVIYGNDTFSLILAQVLGVELISPNDDIIAALAWQWVKRKIDCIKLAEVSSFNFPLFIKPVIPKQFKAQVYNDQQQFREATKGISVDDLVLCADIIKIDAEARCFVLDKTIQTIAIYEGQSEIEGVCLFANEFLTAVTDKLPNTFVMDLGYNEVLGWFILEFNASWGAGLNGCDPKKALSCIQVATRQN